MTAESRVGRYSPHDPEVTVVHGPTIPIETVRNALPSWRHHHQVTEDDGAQITVDSLTHDNYPNHAFTLTKRGDGTSSAGWVRRYPVPRGVSEVDSSPEALTIPNPAGFKINPELGEFVVYKELGIYNVSVELTNRGSARTMNRPVQLPR